MHARELWHPLKQGGPRHRRDRGSVKARSSDGPPLEGALSPDRGRTRAGPFGHHRARSRQPERRLQAGVEGSSTNSEGSLGRIAEDHALGGVSW